MKTFKNITNISQAITNIPFFKPGEEREVDDQIANILLHSPHFEEAKGNTDPQTKSKGEK